MKVARQESVAGLLPLAILSLLAGALTGLVCVSFRLALEMVEHWRTSWLDNHADWKLPELLCLVCGCALACGVAGWLVRRFAPHASGSGIPHVEAVLREELPPAESSLIPVKYFGGLLAIGSGLALGREGPSVQMGASIACLVARAFRRNWADCRTLMAAGAGAGLATAFNAPIAGAVFVLEELVRCFEMRMAVVTFGASAAAIAVAREFIGTAPDFRMADLPHPPLALLPCYVLLGALAGLLGVTYNRLVVWSLSVTLLKHPLPLEFRAGCLGAGIGLLAAFCPAWVGGGESLVQSALSGKTAGTALLLVLLVRFLLGPLSYASRLPGGLFAPMLVIGAQFGLFFGGICLAGLPGSELLPQSFAVVGMAAFFSAVVRAPITGMVLITELTANYNLLLPMLAASFTAILIPTLAGNPPIYDSLKPK